MEIENGKQKLREGNVFTGVCLFEGEVGNIKCIVE